MNNNFTHKEAGSCAIKVSGSAKKISAFIVAIICVCKISTAQNTDLPNPDANLWNAPAGTMVIAMDNTYQGNSGIFNLKAYGLVVKLMNSYAKLRWIITSGKGKDGIDFSVPSYSITHPTIVTAGSKITVISGSNIAQVTNITGTLQVGMNITAPGIPAGTTIQQINTSITQITLSANAVSNQTNKDAVYQLNTYPVTTRNFRAGPFVVAPADTTGLRAIINNFNSTQTAANKVKVYVTASATTMDVRYNMYGLKPKIAVVDDGGNANIHIEYLENASVPVENYSVLPSASGLTLGCYTFASEPHNGSQGAFIDSIKNYVLLGGNFLAQCHAITTYENWVNGHFQTTGGFDNANMHITPNINYQNNDLSFSQFEGNYDANIGGNTQVWTFSAGSTMTNNTFATVRGAGAGMQNYFGATASKMVSGRGGMVYFLGNHDFNSISVIEKVNGQRMYLNAMLTPSATVACPFALPVHLKYFAAKKVNNKQVQINWATASEQNAKEFLIERSDDGIHFAKLATVAATGNSNIEIKYQTIDANPVNGRNFYRMQQIDLDGAKAYSNIVLINMQISNASMDVFPNPARGFTNINLNNLPEKNSISVIDLSGKVVINQTNVTGNTLKLNISTLQTGTYFIKILAGNGNILQNKITVVN